MKTIGTLIATMMIFAPTAFAQQNDSSVAVIFDFIHSSSGKAALGSFKDECLSLMRDDQQGFGEGDYTLRTNSGGNCGGDPSISHAVAFFNVTIRDGMTYLTMMNIVSGDYKPVFAEVTPK